MCVVVFLPIFKLSYSFSSHLAVDKFLGVIEIDVTNCAIDKLVFKVMLHRNDYGKSLIFITFSTATLSCRSLFQIIYSHRSSIFA